MIHYIIRKRRLYVGNGIELVGRSDAARMEYEDALEVIERRGGKLIRVETSYEDVWFCVQRNFYEHMYWDKRGHWENNYCELKPWRTRDYNAAVRKAKAIGVEARVVRHRWWI